MVKGEEILRMTGRDFQRLHVVRQYLDQRIKQKDGSELLGVSDRQFRRLVRRVREEGSAGIIHRSRGRPSNRRTAEKTRQKVLRLYERKYGDFGPTLASEKLRELDGIEVNAETLRLWLRQSGVRYKRRKSRCRRQRRERRPCLGAMVQLDGSHHDWLEGRGARMVLMGYIDDATNRVYGRFYGYEGTFPAFDSFKRYARRYGIPASVYLDRHSTYKSSRELTLEEQLQGVDQPESQFERAMRELGVEVIHAHSPQAKGRVERLFGTLQDRLVKEMRLRKIRTRESANVFLEEYLPEHNRRFSVLPLQSTDVHRRSPRVRELDGVLCVKTERRLNNDWTVAYGGKVYQVEDRIVGKRVFVEERMDGSLRLSCQGKSLKYKELAGRPKRPSSAKSRPRQRAHKPAADHPWRQGYGRSGAAPVDP
jgi:transposase